LGTAWSRSALPSGWRIASAVHAATGAVRPSDDLFELDAVDGAMREWEVPNRPVERVTVDGWSFQLVIDDDAELHEGMRIIADCRGRFFRRGADGRLASRELRLVAMPNGLMSRIRSALGAVGDLPHASSLPVTPAGTAPSPR
jgi:hypothetical protein